MRNRNIFHRITSHW